MTDNDNDVQFRIAFQNIKVVRKYRVKKTLTGAGTSSQIALGNIFNICNKQKMIIIEKLCAGSYFQIKEKNYIRS